MTKEYIGKHVIVRANGAGVFFGVLEAKEGQTVKLSNCRKLYYWSGACAVEQLSVDGVLTSDSCKFTVWVNSMIIENEIQTIPCTQKSINNLTSVEVWKKK